MLCGIGLTRGTSVDLLPVKFNMLDCSFGQMSSPLMAFDALTFLCDRFFHMYYILLAALRQLVSIFCPRSSLPTEKGPERHVFPLSFVLVLGHIDCSSLDLHPCIPPFS